MERRTVLQAAVTTGLGLLFADGTAAQDLDPRSARPQEGDQFVFAGGDRKGATITPDDVVDGPPIAAYPVDARTGVVREGSRLNQVLLIRLDPADVSESIRTRAPQGIVAYSAICTHTGCNEWLWRADVKMLKCSCHESEFDPKDAARVITGPAPRRLAGLPLKIVDGVLMVAGGFTSRVGFEQE